MAGRFQIPGQATWLISACVVLLAGCPVPPLTSADNPAGVSLTRQVNETYAPGDTVTVSITMQAAEGDSISAIGLAESIPAGWTFVSGSGPAIVPMPGAADRLDFAWLTPPAFPYSFSYTLLVPREGRGTVEIAGVVEYRQDAGPFMTEPQVSTLESENPAGVSFARSHTTRYAAGSQVAIAIALDAEDGDLVTALGLSETIPDGWSLVAVSGEAVPDVLPLAGQGGLLEFAWIAVPAFPLHFSYTLAVPADASGPAEITGYAAYRLDSGPLSTEDLTSMIDGPAP